MTIWVGASLVLRGDMTLGQLIAFRILAGEVTGPLLRMANLWQGFQSTALSLERLSDIVDHPQELEVTGEGMPPIPPVIGAIEYKGVSFKFSEEGALNLSNINFKVE